MTFTLDLPPQVEQEYRALAAVLRIPIESLLRDAVIASLAEVSDGGMSPPDPEQWIREYRSWAQAHSALPLLSDEAISRESIYPDHGV